MAVRDLRRYGAAPGEVEPIRQLVAKLERNTGR